MSRFAHTTFQYFDTGLSVDTNIAPGQVKATRCHSEIPRDLQCLAVPLKLRLPVLELGLQPGSLRGVPLRVVRLDVCRRLTGFGRFLWDLTDDGDETSVSQSAQVRVRPYLCFFFRQSF